MTFYSCRSNPIRSIFFILRASLLAILRPSLLAIACGPLATNALAVDFEKDVAPILETHCMACHREAEAKHTGGEIRFDTFETISTFIVPRDPDASELIAQITGPEPEMPKKGKPLTAAQVETLRGWVAAGAPWPSGRVLRDDPIRDLDWWSLRPIARHSPPDHPSGFVDPPRTEAPSRADTSRNPVDAFLNAKMAEAGVVPVGPADPITLLRRLTYDLTGLPPTEAQIRAFSLEDYERFVDQLLAAPEFGEKWGQGWLDLARYAETHGYDKDKLRGDAWPYRDYVIRSLNDDKPYDRFVKEQIAGDVLYPDDPDGIIALGFLAAGPWDFIGHVEVGEGKVDGRIAKHLDRDEMITAVFNAFTSTTVQCAQCHHHKFDPVKMEDYYRLHAVFAAVDRAPRVYQGLSPEQQSAKRLVVTKLDEARRERTKLEQDLRSEVDRRMGTDAQRLKELAAMRRTEPRPEYGWHSEIGGDPKGEKWVQVDLGRSVALKLIRLLPAFDNFAGIGAGFGFPTEFRVEIADDADFKGDSVRQVFIQTDASPTIVPGREVTIDAAGMSARYVRITATKLAHRQNDYIFALAELEAIRDASKSDASKSDASKSDASTSDASTSDAENVARGAKVMSKESIEANPRWGRANLTDGIYHTEFPDATLLAQYRQLQERAAAIEKEVRGPDQVAKLDAFARSIKDLEQKLAAFPPGQTVYAAATRFDAQGGLRPTGGKPRPIALLQRGDIRAPAQPMRPGMPPLWPGAQAEFSIAGWSTDTVATEGDAEGPPIDPESLARGALAEAITSRDNPLLWRSIANRVWQWTFGTPLVGTPNDFGRMGMLPTHPELLDYLAAQLRDSPTRSLKPLIRLLVTSDAYRRASSHHEANATIDAGNSLRWRGTRRRLTAEEYRDTVLMVAGRLRLDARGGASFRDFVIEKPEHSPHFEYHLHNPEDPEAMRRSIYRFVVRSQPQPFLTALDCADPSQSVPARDESTTSLQALAQWNNRLVEAMSRAVAERVSTTEDPIDVVCRAAVSRSPSPDERAVLETTLRESGPASLARVVFNWSALVYLD